MLDLVKERNELFDDKFRIKSSDFNRIKLFCTEITHITGVQVFNEKGMIYEYLPKVYNSALQISKKE